MGFFTFVNFFAHRVKLSVAIIAMVNSTYNRELAKVSTNSSFALFDEHELRASNVNSSSRSDDHEYNVSKQRTINSVYCTAI